MGCGCGSKDKEDKNKEEGDQDKIYNKQGVRWEDTIFAKIKKLRGEGG
ncbi:MAG: hypothetical protein QXO37_09445 [Candidatus Nitrosocaldaceae archaeon]